MATTKREVSQGAVVHWDGKLMKSILRKKVDRLPVKITYQDIDQLLGVPISEGTGKSDAQCVFALLKYWKLADEVQACCFDTTSTNTGRLNGAAIQLEQMLNRSLLYLPCPHHIYELLLKAIFEKKVSVSSGPDVPLFNRFQDAWDNIKTTDYKPGTEDPTILSALENCVEPTKTWILDQLEKETIRADYKEFLELSLLFIGGKLPIENARRTTIFHLPGPVHHARWMAKAIYSLKIMLFRDQFKLTKREKDGLGEVCVFIIRHYLKLWFKCTDAAGAPLQDLTFVQTMLLDSTTDLDANTKLLLLQKFRNHLWYLSEEAIALAFFDVKVFIDVKRKMAQTLLKCIEDDDDDDEREPSKKFVISMKKISTLQDKDLSHFVTKKTLRFFERFGISYEFLKANPTNWMTNADYTAGLKIVWKLKVVNDTAERGVKLMEKYNNILTKDEEERQFILLVVSDYAKKYTSYTKKHLMAAKK